MATLPQAESVHSTEPSERFAVVYQKVSGEKEVLHVTDSPEKAMASFAAVARPESARSAMMQAGDSVALQDRELQLESGWIAEKNGIYQSKFGKPETRAAYEVERARIDSAPPLSPDVSVPRESVAPVADVERAKTDLAPPPSPDVSAPRESVAPVADVEVTTDDPLKRGKAPVLGEITGDDIKERVPGQPLVPSMDYSVDKSGKVTYLIDGKPVVSDALRGVTVIKPTKESYALAMQVAIERYGPTITLDGDAAFVKGMTEAARESGLKLTLHDARNASDLPLIISPRDVEVNVDPRKETPVVSKPVEPSPIATPAVDVAPAVVIWNDVSEDQKRTTYVDLAAGRPVTLPTSAPTQLHHENAVAQQARGDDGWENLQSVPGASLRMNLTSRVAEVHFGGHDETVSGLGAINAWCKEHHASAADQERMVAFDVAASRGNSPEQSQTQLNERDPAMATDKAIPVTPGQQNSPPREDIRRVGEQMPRADWQEAIDILKSKSPETSARIYLPKAEADYAGKVVMITDTHIVQQVGRGTAVAHDLGKLENGKELNAAIDNNSIRIGSQVAFKYDQDKGKGEVVSYAQHRNDAVKKDLQEWAKEAMPNAKSRDTFLKHLDKGMSEITKPVSSPVKSQAPVLAPMAKPLSPTRDR